MIGNLVKILSASTTLKHYDESDYFKLTSGNFQQHNLYIDGYIAVNAICQSLFQS